MNLSKLIDELEAIYRKHGNMPVIVETGDDAMTLDADSFRVVHPFRGPALLSIDLTAGGQLFGGEEGALAEDAQRD